MSPSPFITGSPTVHDHVTFPARPFFRGGAALLAAGALAIASAPGLLATSVTLQGGFGYPNAKDSSGTPLEAGHKVAIGTFVDGFDPSADSTDLPTLLANWREFHFTTTETIDGDDGSFWLKHSSVDGTNAEGYSFPGKKIYLLLTRTDAAYTEPAADGSNVVDFAIFTSDDPAWIFRSPPSERNLPPGDLSSLNTAQIDLAIAGTADPATGTFALASYSPVGGASAFDQWVDATFGDGATIAPEDEVGSYGLAALAVFALDSDPNATAPPYATITGEDGRIGIEFTRKKASVSGYNTFAQACQTLSSWSMTVTESLVSETDTTETIHAFPEFGEADDTSKAFFRIRVEPVE